MGLVDAHQDVEVGRKPAIVFGEETGDELSGVVGADSDEILPGYLGPGFSRDDDVSSANGDLAAVEVEGCGVGKEPV